MPGRRWQVGRQATQPKGERMANIIKTCPWVMGGIGSPQCGKVKRWHWEIDDDGNRRKSYETFCPEHLKKAKAMEADD